MFKKILLTILLMFFVLPAFAWQGEYLRQSVSDDDYGLNMYTPGLPVLFLNIQDTMLAQPVETVGFMSSMADVLANIEEPENRIDEDCYYIIAARKIPKYKRQIRADILKKFGEKSPVPDILNWRPARTNALILFSMFKKDIDFYKHFDNLQNAPFNGKGEAVKYFGSKNSMKRFRGAVVPLFYNDENDFAVLINARGENEIILYRTDSDEPVDILFDEMNFKIDPKNPVIISELDKFRAPYVNVKEIITYDELSGKKIKGSRYVIEKTLEEVQFTMDLGGQKAKAENEDIKPVSVSNGKNSPYTAKARNFYFDKPFVVFAKEKKREYPYFMLRIKDSRYLVK